ncbi:MAG: TonB-dependent receptor [Bacteroidota bacterium]
MSSRSWLLIVALLLGTFLQAGTISGTVRDLNNEALPGAAIWIEALGLGVTANLDDVYRISDIPTGTYQLEVSFLGYASYREEVILEEGETKSVDFTLEEDAANLDQVLVRGKSESTERSQAPIQIASIDLVELQSESADLVAVLDRTSGVRVRQSGGLGSNTSIQLNGLTGLSVRTYLDGIPLDVLGGSIQLNNIPVNTIERVDVYKGVMPIDVGTDALAGGINVISRQVDYDYLDVSYQLGSFNTHIGALNGVKTLGDQWFVAFNGFYNYSDNNYEIRATQRTANFQEIEVEV